MKKRVDRREYDYIPSYICTNCGYATISPEIPKKCDKCEHWDFDVVKVKFFKDVRQVFERDERRMGPI